MGKIRLACLFCDRSECDGVDQIPATWFDVDEVQSREKSIRKVDPESDNIFNWYTHLGVCPDFQEAEFCPADEVTDLRANDVSKRSFSSTPPATRIPGLRAFTTDPYAPDYLSKRCWLVEHWDHDRQ